MKYLLLISNSADTDRAIEADDGERLGAVHSALADELRASGEYVALHELAQDDAIVVRTGEGRPAFTDGPFTEGREFVGGYYIVDVADRERAVEIARRLYEAETSVIEVRRIVGA